MHLWWGEREEEGTGVIANNEMRTTTKESHNFQPRADEEKSDWLAVTCHHYRDRILKIRSL